MSPVKLLKLSVSVKPVKRNVIRNTNAIHKLGKLVLAEIMLIDGVYKAKVINNTSELNSDFMLLNFTERSFSCKNRNSIFTKSKDKHNHWVRIISNSSFITDSDNYIPFAPSWIVSGYICKVNGSRMFDFNDLYMNKGNYKTANNNEYNEC